MKLIQHQVVFPANFKPPAPPPGQSVFGSMDMPMKAAAVAAAVLSSTFGGYALFKPPAAAPAQFKAGSDTYTNQINFQTIIRPEAGQVPFKPPAAPTGFQSYDNRVVSRTFVSAQDAFQHKPANVFVLPTGFQSYDVQINPKTVVGPQDVRFDFKPPPAPTGWQTYDTPTKVTQFVRPDVGLTLFQPVVIPGAVYSPGADSYNNQINFQTIVRLETGQLLFNAPPPVQLPTGFQSWDNYFFAKPNPLAVHAELSPFIPALPSVPASTIPSGDGPPWHLTQKEIKRLLHYREELASIQRAYDLKRRKEIDDLMRDVNIAAGRPGEVEAIEQQIAKLPALPKKSFFSIDLRNLKSTVQQNIIERQQDEEEYEIKMAQQFLEEDEQRIKELIKVLFT